MTTTTKSKKVNKKMSASKSLPLALISQSAPTPDITNTLIGLTDSAVRTFSVLSATLMFAQPQFVKEANPTNILGLADLFFKYATGRVDIQQPDEAKQPTA